VWGFCPPADFGRSRFEAAGEEGTFDRPNLPDVIEPVPSRTFEEGFGLGVGAGEGGVCEVWGGGVAVWGRSWRKTRSLPEDPAVRGL